MSQPWILRPGTVDDVAAITALFAETIRTVNARDYNQREVEAWSAGAADRQAWRAKLLEQSFFLAHRDDELVGFGSVTDSGYLDYLFVHRDHQRRGVAAALLARLEREAREHGQSDIWAYASKTALGFFLRHGFRHEGDKETTVRGVRFRSARVIKSLG